MVAEPNTRLLVSIRATAAAFGVSRGRVERWVRAGRAPGLILMDGSVAGVSSEWLSESLELLRADRRGSK